MVKQITKRASVPEKQQKWFPLLWFALAAFLLFGKTLTYQYTFLDDHNLVLYNLDHLKSFSYIKQAFTEDVFHLPGSSSYYYRPVMTLTFMADAMIGGGSFIMFHFSNILYHIVAVYLLYLFFTLAGFDRLRSFLFALIFLVHPVLTQAVAWVPGRNDSLLAIFILGSFISWIKYLGGKKPVFLALHLFLFLCSLFTKENAVVMPLLAVVWGIFFFKPGWKQFILPASAWLAMIIAWAYVRNHVLDGEGMVPFTQQALSLTKTFPALLPYLGKSFFPFDLSVFPIMADMNISLIFGLIAIAFILFLSFRAKSKNRFLLCFGLLWFLAFITPALIYMPGQVPNFSEHRVYLALAGILLIWINSGEWNVKIFSGIPSWVLPSGIILAFAVLTFIHSQNFRDQFAFWQNAVQTSPNHAFNYKNLGSMYVQAGDLKTAEQYLRQSVRLNPSEPLANGDLGYICVMTGRPSEAEKFYLEEIRVNPKYDHVHYNLGLLYLNTGHPEEGVRELEKTIAMNPLHEGTYKDLIKAYNALNRPADAARISAKAREYGIPAE